MIDWIHTTGLLHYDQAVTEMEKRVASIRAGTANQAVWLVEHPPLYTAGTSAKSGDLLDARFPVYQTGRGGQYTYHGPGQRVAYVMMDLAAMGGDIRKYVWQLEEWIIRTLAEFDIIGERRDGRIGIWVSSDSAAVGQNNMSSDSPCSSSEAVAQNNMCSSSEAIAQNNMCSSNEAIGSSIQENKIAAIGVRVRSGVTYHGIAINVSPDLSHFSGIVPCGISQFGMTSFHALGKKISLQELDQVLQAQFYNVFDFAA